jgi:tRNA(fMet)-specific endonuclease VapC
MAHPHIVIDTSIIIDHLRKRNKRKSFLFNMVDDYTLYIPTIVEFELFAGAIDAEKRQDIHFVLQFCSVLPLTSEIVQHAAHLYQTLKQKNQVIEIRDLFIASTAIVYAYPLMTLNTQHFSRIETLHLFTLPTLEGLLDR